MKRPRLPRPFSSALFVIALLGVSAPGFAANVDVSSAAAVKPALPKIPDRTFTLTDFGAVGDGKTMNTEAFKKAVAAVDKAGGGKLIVPKGVFRTAPFTLCSSLDFHLDEGAVIQAPDTFEEMGLPNPASFKTQAEADAAYRVPDPLITGRNLHDVALTGSGTIDGSGRHWWNGPNARCARRGTKAIRAAWSIAVRISSRSTASSDYSSPTSR